MKKQAGLEMDTMLHFKDSKDYQRAKDFLRQNRDMYGNTNHDDSDQTLHVSGNYRSDSFNDIDGPLYDKSKLDKGNASTILNHLSQKAGVRNGTSATLSEYYEELSDHYIPVHSLKKGWVTSRVTDATDKSLAVQKLANKLHPGDNEQELMEDEGLRPFWKSESVHNDLLNKARGLHKKASIGRALGAVGVLGVAAAPLAAGIYLSNKMDAKDKANRLAHDARAYANDTHFHDNIDIIKLNAGKLNRLDVGDIFETSEYKALDNRKEIEEAEDNILKAYDNISGSPYATYNYNKGREYKSNKYDDLATTYYSIPEEHYQIFDEEDAKHSVSLTDSEIDRYSSLHQAMELAGKH